MVTARAITLLAYGGVMEVFTILRTVSIRTLLKMADSMAPEASECNPSPMLKMTTTLSFLSILPTMYGRRVKNTDSR